MYILECNKYIDELKFVANNNDFLIDKLKDKSIMIVGGNGLIGSYMVDLLMYLNEEKKMNCKVYIVSRNLERMQDRFKKYKNCINCNLIEADIIQNLDYKITNLDYLVHLASNTHPIAYSTKPIETITTNIIGTNNLLQFAVNKNVKRFIFTSSCEIYGENLLEEKEFKEDFCGYIDCNTLRAGYTESKRCGEALCQAYIKEKGLEIVIPRLSRVYGPTMLIDDSKAMSQFIRNAVNDEDIVLKSVGNQIYSYTYVADAVIAILISLFYGKSGEAYNISDPNSIITLKELAIQISEQSNSKVVFSIPAEAEKQGYSKATYSVLNSDKILSLGWNPVFGFEKGIKSTIEILKEINTLQT